MAFPGATHTRYVHSLGSLHLAGLAFDQAYHGWSFSSPTAKERFRAAVRVAALCHDLGHPPFSHCTEFAMPAVGMIEAAIQADASPAHPVNGGSLPAGLLAQVLVEALAGGDGGQHDIDALLNTMVGRDGNALGGLMSFVDDNALSSASGFPNMAVFATYHSDSVMDMTIVHPDALAS